MRSELLAAVALLLIFGLLIIITNYLFKHYKWSAENSRKFLHVSGGILSLAVYRFIQSHWWILAITGIAFIILLITFIKKSMPSVHGTKRVSFGSVIFPLSIYICFFISKKWQNDLLFYIPVSLLTFPDTLAEAGGNKWGHFSRSFFNGQKTLAGSICFAISTFLICLTFLFYFTPLSPVKLIIASFLLTITTTIAELVTLKGFDNITIPVMALITLYYLIIA